MQFSLNNSVKEIINTIENAGGEAYIVGGCVRDMLLGLTPEDFDITTSLPPEKIISLFNKTVATGLKHGTVTVIINGDCFEVTTYRTDGTYKDSRHPEEVRFVSSLKEDLARRDFTVNAIAYNPKTGIVDEFGGINDLNNKILRAVGNPEKRFKEDALRIMRLYRFACQLGFNIDNTTEKAALSLSKSLIDISRERIAAELFKALLSNNPERLNPLINTSSLEFCGIGKGNIDFSLSLLPKERDIRFYRFTELINSDPIAVTKALKTDKALTNFCKEVCRIQSSFPQTERDCKITLKDYSKKSVLSAFLLLGKNTEVIDKIIEEALPYKISHLKISGDDLIKAGYSGKELGEKLDLLLLHVIDHPEDNKRDTLLNLI